jgi:predicted DNA-binding transcriptional regulator AlpA
MQARPRNRIHPDQPLFLSAPETAELLRISPVTLSKWRIEGRGPPYRKLGRRVVYERADLIEWTADQRRLSTSEPAAHRDGQP